MTRPANLARLRTRAPGRVGAIAFDLDRALARARRRAALRVFAIELVFAIDRAFAHGRARARRRAGRRDLALGLVWDLARASDRTSNDAARLRLDRGCNGGSADDILALTVDLALGLARDIDGARARALALHVRLDHALDRDLGMACDRARGLARDIDRGLARNLERAGGATARGRKASAVPVAAPAARVAGAAARLLPARGRARYAEEYQSELFELAAAGEPRRRQVLFALRLLRTSPVLGLELRAPRRRKAGP